MVLVRGTGFRARSADQDRFGSPNSNKSASECVAITRSAGLRQRAIAVRPERFFGIDKGLGNESGRFGVLDAQASA